MKLFNKSIICLSVGTMLFGASCANESPWDNGQGNADGKIFLNLNTDETVFQGSRAEGYSSVIPHPSEFSISLNSTDGSYKNSWNTLEAFNNESGFPMGSYIIKASFGEDAQEGFSNPYFTGQTKVNVSLGETSDVTITATLANSMVSIRYDEKFDEFYPAHSSSIQTEGHDPVVFVQDESRPAYITSGNVKLGLTLTDENGNTIKLEPANFKAEARKHYIVTFGLEGNTDRGYGILTIDWSEELIHEDEEIILSEEMFKEPKPTLSLVGANQEEELIEGLNYEEVNPEFHIYAYGGISEAVLNISADAQSKLPPCGGTVILVGETPVSQSLLLASGIDCSGILDRKSDMAVINLKEMVRLLQPGEYTVSLNFKDSLKRSPDTSITFRIKVTSLDYEIISYEQPEFLANEIIVVLGTNSSKSAEQFKFKSWDSKKSPVDAKAELLRNYDFTGINTIYENKYAYKLSIPEIEDLDWMVYAYIPSKNEKSHEIKVKVPQFKLECDAFATYSKIRVSPDVDERITNLVLNKGKLYDNNGSLIQDFANNSSNIKDGIITINNLNQYTDYNYTISVGSKLEETYKNNVIFKTEKEVQVANNDFTQLAEPLEVYPIYIGGKFTITFVGTSTSTPRGKILRDIPASWANLNDLTCYKKSTNMNTWYVEPSTYMDDGMVLLRSVGYHHDGWEIPTTGSTTTYYNTTYVSRDKVNSSCGELFLGSYKFDEGEFRTDGIPFTSRPSKLSFQYKYNSMEKESGVAFIRLKSDDGTILFEKTKLLSASSTLITEDIEIKDYPFGKKATELELSFKSSDSAEPYIKGPDNLNEGYTWNTYLTEQEKKTPNDFKTFYSGSQLWLKNVKFEY